MLALTLGVPVAPRHGPPGPGCSAWCSPGWLYWGWRLARAEWFAHDIRKGLRVLSRDPSALRWELLWFKPTELGGQPLPTAGRTGGEERYELLRKFQAVLTRLGYRGIVVLIDRVDEPQLIEGDPRKMRALIWPLLDHKFLRHPGIGVKLLLPIELAYYLEKEDKDFYDRARPDKLNMIKPLRWTGPSLYDLASDRLRACAIDPFGERRRARGSASSSTSRSSDDALKDALGNLRTPRQLFKFLHRLIEEHCHRHTEDAPPVDGRRRHLPHRPTRPTSATSTPSTAATATADAPGRRARSLSGRFNGGMIATGPGWPRPCPGT